MSEDKVIGAIPTRLDGQYIIEYIVNYVTKDFAVGQKTFLNQEEAEREEDRLLQAGYMTNLSTFRKWNRNFS